MTQDLDFSQYRADINGYGNELLERYPGIPVLDPQSDTLIAEYDRAIAALIAAVPLDPGTVENKRSDPRRQIDEYDDGKDISAKLFTLRKSSFEMRQGLGNHYHQHTGADDSNLRFVEGFRMIDVGGVLFVNQYTRDTIGTLVPGITVPYEVKPGNILVFAKEQAHTFFLSPGQFQGVLATAFDEKDLHSAKLGFS